MGITKMVLNIPRNYIYVWHILAVGPLLIWLGWQKGQGIPEWIWSLLIVLGIALIGYQSFLLWKHN